MRGWWLVLACAPACGRVSFGPEPLVDAVVIPDAPVDAAVACTAAACPPGFTAVALGCYRLDTAPAKWLDAERACEAAGAHLVVEDSVEEHYIVHNLAAALPQVWIGWTDRVGPDNTFTWVLPDEGGLLQSNGCVFGPGEPDAGDLDHCAAQHGADVCGDYEDLNCALAEPFVCECDGRLADPTRY